MLLIAGLCALATMLACAGPALASRAHEFTGSFGEQCTAEPCEEGQLKEPDGVAVNEETGDVYVVDKGSSRVVRFDKEGEFQSEINGSGLLLGEATAAGGLGREGEVPTGTFISPEGIAVDNSCAIRKVSDSELTQEKCEEEDPSNGDVYVVDAGNRVIDKYSPAGKYLGQIAEAGGKSFKGEGLDGVAVDPAGAVWVYREAPEVDHFTNGAPNPEGTPNEFVAPRIEVRGLSGFGFGARAFAVDSTGAFYVLTGFGGEPPGPVSQLSPSSGPPPEILIEEVDGHNSNAVAVDQTSNDAFVGNGTNVGVFNSEGTLLERLGEEEGAKRLTGGEGIGVNASAQTLYVADAATGTVVVFGPAQPSTPKVEGESFSAVSANSAKLEGQLNPRSEPGEAPTEYAFQYGRCANAGKCQESAYETSTPEPDGQVEADFNVHAVSTQLTGLLPSTTYHFRLIAKNSHGEGQPGAEVSFTTEAAGGELRLPDSRGWELVSPPEKAGRIEPIAEGNTGGVVQAAASGDGITYLANAPTEADPQGNANLIQILSSRGPASWSSRDLTIPHTSATGLAKGEGPEYKFFDPELDTAAVQPFGQFPPLSEEASEPTAYLEDLGPGCASHCFRPLVTAKPGFANVPEGTVFGEEAQCIPTGSSGIPGVCGPRFRGATDDLSHVVLSSTVALAPGAGPGLYEWSRSTGRLSPVSMLPNKKPVPEEGVASALGLAQQAARRAISNDGSRIVWSAEPNLYSRDMSREETVQLDEAACSAEEGCESGGGHFQIASTDGSRVFFTDTRRLTSNAGTSGSDLYECRLALSLGKLACELSDLTPKQGEEGADVQGGVLGASEDGSNIYFVASGVQSEAPNSRGQSAVAGQPNLYVRHNGATSFIATLSRGDSHDWGIEGGTPLGLARQPTRVSNNGQWLELMSQARPTGYDNRDAKTDAPVAEVYLYDAASGVLRCASCEPSGVRPTGIEYAKIEPADGGLAGGPRGVWPATSLVAANVPGWTEIATGNQLASRYQARYLSNEGRLFFDSLDALAPQDANGTEDVYQYEPPGVGGCIESSTAFGARQDGCVELISSGRSAQESAFLDASESGNDVFFLTSAKLSELDGDTAFDVYDAHVCTGEKPCITFPDVQSPPCTTEASCKASPTPQPSIFAAPASATFQGPGNPPPPPPAKPKAKTAAQIRAEKLKRALKACHAKRKKAKRHACEKQARKKYGPAEARHARHR
jgi:DNA-binding beta-propeller fold protein YncE